MTTKMTCQFIDKDEVREAIKAKGGVITKESEVDGGLYSFEVEP